MPVLELAGYQLTLGLRVRADVTHDRLAQQLGADQLTYSLAGHGGVIGDHGEVALFLVHDLVDDTFGRADPHEAPNHDACAVGNHSNGSFERDSLHLYRLPSLAIAPSGPACPSHLRQHPRRSRPKQHHPANVRAYPGWFCSSIRSRSKSRPPQLRNGRSASDVRGHAAVAFAPLCAARPDSSASV
jgi:hypothetical protein